MGRRGESTRAGVMAVGVVICGCVVGDIGDVPSAGITKWRVGEQLADLSARSLLRALGEAAGHLLCALGSVPFSVHELVGDCPVDAVADRFTAVACRGAVGL